MEIREYEERDLSSLNELLQEAFFVSKKGKVSSGDVELVSIADGRVVGHLLLSRCLDPIRDEYYFFFFFLCVHSDYRRRHIATQLFEKVFSLCHDENIAYLELTSNPSRVAAHHLYQKLGFQVRDTCVFRKEIL